MIILGNPHFATAMQLAGISNSRRIRSREEGLKALHGVPKDELILANTSIAKMLPELGEYKNVVTVPDSSSGFGSIDDLKQIVKNAVGMEIEV